MDNIEMEVITNNDNIDMNVISDDDNIQQDVTTETGTKNYNKLYNKPQINGVELTGNKSLDDLGIDQDFVKDSNYVHTDNNYTTNEKTKLADLHNYDDTEIRASLNNKVDKVEGKGLSTNDYTDEDKTKLASLENYDDTEVKSDITNLQTNKADKSEIEDFITKDANNLTYYTLKTNTGSLIDLEINSSTYVVTLTLKDQDGNSISTDSIDLPLETVVVGGRYDSASKKVILTLENGNEIEFSVADLVAGLQTEITSNNKLASDLVDDTNSGNKFVTTSEKQTWNNKVDTSDLNDYVKFTDTASNNSLGVVQGGSSGFKVGPTGVGYVQKATDANIDAKTNNYNSIVPSNLDYAMKVGITTNSLTLTDTEKNNARNWLDAVGSNDIMTSGKLGIAKVGNAGISINPNTGLLYIAGATPAIISAKANNYLPIVPRDLDYAVKTGVTTNTISLTDQEKDNAKKWLSAEDEMIVDTKGTNFDLKDSKARKIPSMTLYGKSSQNVNSGSNMVYMTDDNYFWCNTNTIRFGSYTEIRDNGSSLYFPNGALSGGTNSRFLVYQLPTLQTGEWYSIRVTSDDNCALGINLAEYPENPADIYARTKVIAQGRDYSWTWKAEANKVYMLEVRSCTAAEGGPNATTDPFAMKIQVNKGQPRDWEPYTGGIPTQTQTTPAPITDITSESISITDGVNTQSATLNLTARGIPVASGGNYTDEKGQQWICDTIDKNTGKYIQRINRLTGTQIGANAGGWYGDNETQNKYVGFSLTSHPNASWDYRTDMMCTNFVSTTGIGTNDKVGIQVAGSEGADTLNIIIGFGLDSTLTYEQRKAYVQNLTDDFSIVYALKTPVETDLTDSQLEQLDLSTYNGETTITSNIPMEFNYVANAKNYVDNKIASELADKDKYVLLAEYYVNEQINTPITWTSSGEDDMYDDIVAIGDNLLGNATIPFYLSFMLSNSKDYLGIGTNNVMQSTATKNFVVEAIRMVNNRWKIEKRGAQNGIADAVGTTIQPSTQYKDKIKAAKVYTSNNNYFTQGRIRLYGRKRF